MKEILNIIHKTIYQFFDTCEDDKEVPMSDKDKLLLEVNKAICNNLKALEQEPCEDCISRQAVLNLFNGSVCNWEMSWIRRKIEKLPSVIPKVESEKKDLRELEYEREMQVQAEYMSRWKLRKEIKKKLRALRKKVKADEASLPHLKAISRRLDDVENPLEPCVMENPDSTAESGFSGKNPTIIWQPCHTEHYHRTFVYDPRTVIAPSKDIILKEMAEEFGYELLKAGAIQYRIYDNKIIEDKKQVEMKVDVVVEDRC